MPKNAMRCPDVTMGPTCTAVSTVWTNSGTGAGGGAGGSSVDVCVWGRDIVTGLGVGLPVTLTGAARSVGTDGKLALVSHSTFALSVHVSCPASNSVPAGQFIGSPRAFPRLPQVTYPAHPLVGRGPGAPIGQKYSPVQLGELVGRFTSILPPDETSVGGPTSFPPFPAATPTEIATTSTRTARGIPTIRSLRLFRSFSRLSARRDRGLDFPMPPPYSRSRDGDLDAPRLPPAVGSGMPRPLPRGLPDPPSLTLLEYSPLYSPACWPWPWTP
mmetsp:Transcript_12332/g.28203  ORF Transcript_12332/g.28203 Transcript_12332/m.28203 type:complete len:272 (-) Transcript_12332:273-1088(-)